MPLRLEPTIYAITHRGYSGLSNEAQIERLLAAGARLIQLRDKELSGESLAAEARRLAALCRQAGARLIVNDDPRAAVLAEAQGVHVGQGDLLPTQAREIIGPDRILGVSTHNERQFDAALEQPVDYIAVGPVFGTATKENPDPATGVGLVEYAAKRIRGTNKALVAIGGMTLTNLPRLLDASPEVIPAVIGGIMKEKDIGIAWKEFERRRREHTAARSR